MDRDGTAGRRKAGQESRSLVVLAPARDMPTGRGAGGRPMAGFLTQLIVESDPDLRPARADRTRDAAALYGQAARRG